MDLDSVADELYGLRPSEFISARSIRSSEAKQAGDRQLSASIAKLKRPTKSAWLVNLLARLYSEQLSELLDLGEDMHAAQNRLAATELREIARRRLEVVAALTKKAKQIAGEAGEPVSDEMARELGSTLEAAFSDRSARDAVRLGRLTAALDYSGFGDMHSAPQPEPLAAKARNAGRRTTGEDRGQRRSIGERRRLAHVTLIEAQAEVSRAGQALEGRNKDVVRAMKKKPHLEQLMEDLNTELSRLRVEVSRAAGELLVAQQLRDAAQSTVEAAEAQVIRAQQELDELQS